MADFSWYLDRYRRYLVRRNRATITIEKYVEILGRMNRDLPCGVLRACVEELEDWILVDGRAPASKELYRTIVCGFFLFATDEIQLGERRLDFDPARYLEKVSRPRKAPRPAQQEQLRVVFARAREPFRTWCITAAGQGLRCVDLSHLDREDCTAEIMYVRGKGGVEATLPMHPEVWKVIEPLPAGPICRGPRGERATARQISVRGNRHLHRLGMRFTMHKLRHYFGTEVHEASGGDVFVSQDMLRHASPSTTRQYVLVNRSKAAAAVAAIPLPV